MEERLSSCKSASQIVFFFFFSLFSVLFLLFSLSSRWVHDGKRHRNIRTSEHPLPTWPIEMPSQLT
ncbi:hypothetical protein BDW42DRAFT_115341 [Aspergillus taichungensis]|uniref:Uncharacterized protein n=1 Tax=Aspergillus taichungensis TaxID=482145 RepID=A0A2J5HS64_9EURO|nr:hypothetical protein BDW42DRAFT_115341 [Aspergillus taichungensis]